MGALLVLAFALLQEGPSSLDLAAEAERVARLSLEAAKTDGFYFIASVSSSTLALNLRGVPLATYAVESIELGHPLLGGPESRREPLDLYSCTSPPRAPAEIVPGTPAAPPGTAGDEAKEEKPPRRVVLTCDPPLAVHLVSASSVPGVRERLRIGADRAGELRIRIAIADADAERLLASVPPKVQFILSRVPAAKEAVGSRE